MPGSANRGEAVGGDRERAQQRGGCRAPQPIGELHRLQLREHADEDRERQERRARLPSLEKVLDLDQG